MGVVLYAANSGYLKNVELTKIQAFEAALLSYMNSEHSELMNKTAETGAWNSDVETSFKAAIDKFVETQTY